MPDVAVIGAGISGLVAARTLGERGFGVRVFEAAPRVGGALRTDDIHGVAVDVGAEAFHTAAPEPLELIEELGLADDLVEAAPGPTWIWSDDRLRPLPAGVGPMGPTRLGPLARSGLISPTGLVRAGLEPLIRWRPPTEDVDVGTAIAARFGDEVRDRLVDPLLGSLHAGDIGRLSLRSATPQLAAVLDRGDSLLLSTRRNGRRRGAGRGPGFVTLRGGAGRVAERLATSLPGPVNTGTRIVGVVPDGRILRVLTEDGDEISVDGVVLALPAAAAASVLRDVAPAAVTGLEQLRAADVAVAVLGLPGVDATNLPALRGTGILTPSVEGRLLKAAVFLSTKWPHLAGGERFLVRVSAGRAGEGRIHELDDGSLVERLHDELAAAVGPLPPPDAAHVVRWPGAMPQLDVGHRPWVDAIRAGLPDRVVLAGAPYEGVGVAACIRSGRGAAGDLVDRFAEVRA